MASKSCMPKDAPVCPSPMAHKSDMHACMASGTRTRARIQRRPASPRLVDCATGTRSSDMPAMVAPEQPLSAQKHSLARSIDGIPRAQHAMAAVPPWPMLCSKERLRANGFATASRYSRRRCQHSIAELCFAALEGAQRRDRTGGGGGDGEWRLGAGWHFDQRCCASLWPVRCSPWLMERGLAAWRRFAPALASRAQASACGSADGSYAYACSTPLHTCEPTVLLADRQRQRAGSGRRRVMRSHASEVRKSTNVCHVSMPNPGKRARAGA